MKEKVWKFLQIIMHIIMLVGFVVGAYRNDIIGVLVCIWYFLQVQQQLIYVILKNEITEIQNSLIHIKKGE